MTGPADITAHTSRRAFKTALATVAMLIAAGVARADDATNLADLFADCSGVWQAVSIMEARIGKDISAQRYATLSQAASASASYILAVDHEGKNGAVRQAAGWDDYVTPRAIDARVEMLTLIDDQDGAEVDGRMKVCAATLGTQSEIVQLIRDQDDASGGY